MNSTICTPLTCTTENCTPANCCAPVLQPKQTTPRSQVPIEMPTPYSSLTPIDLLTDTQAAYYNVPTAHQKLSSTHKLSSTQNPMTMGKLKNLGARINAGAKLGGLAGMIPFHMARASARHLKSKLEPNTTSHFGCSQGIVKIYAFASGLVTLPPSLALAAIGAFFGALAGPCLSEKTVTQAQDTRKFVT